MLTDEIKQILQKDLCRPSEVYDIILQRLTEGDLTIDENPADHFPVYFLPYNLQTKQIFLIHHRKSGLWISPGGHIDKGEGLLDTLNREVEEELGLANYFNRLPEPFLFTHSHINNQVQTCKTHYDIWFRFDTDGQNFHTDPREFISTEWLTIEQAEQRVIDPANKIALQVINRL